MPSDPANYAVKEAKRLIPEAQGQRQDSTTDQMITVLELARRAGCYDAHDLLVRFMERQGVRG